MARNIKLTLAYDGTHFNGWQVQPERATIQGALGEAIERITGEKVLPQGSGRTDAGVHALAQVATFSTTSSIPSGNLLKALNSMLPETIRVLVAEEVEDGFHARYSAMAKTYEYRIYRGEICPPFVVNQVYHHPYPLLEEAMKEAATLVTGEHDFTSFAAVDPEKNAPEGNGEKLASNVRKISMSRWERRGEELIYRVRGNGFLHHMVRNLVGTFLMVGKGTIEPSDISSIITARQRSAAGPTAPASGLYLVSVEY
ncbi:MAG TPA: tRNA pseudouridine(38-40) synthase TruA [Terriglobales bacterium]|nr:tRNA pseudouridine(38-40) synthase TruA [Terriglobales bacterium]